MKVIEWLDERVRIIDQTRLPQEEVYLELTSYQDMASAITELKIRGAPAIGVAGGYGMVLGALKLESRDRDEFLKELQSISQSLASTRPTARNLFQVIERMNKVAEAGKDAEQIKKALVNEAAKVHAEAAEADKKLSQLGAELIGDGFSILTHCNTGPLATAGYGTALGIIKWAHGQGKNIKVFATETRPLCQGARLTAWELKRANIPFKLITDSMVGYFMCQAKINCIIVGADRIAGNGDTANKIGTYTLSVLSKEHFVPFYIAAPTTTIDPKLSTGDEIPIEERSPEEITHIHGVRVVPEGVEVLNPAFDVTPHQHITAIITEKGIIREPYGEGIRGVTNKEAT